MKRKGLMNLLSSPYLVVYAYMKDFGSSMKPYIGSSTINVLVHMLSVVLMLTIAAIVAPLAILRFCVHIFLKLKYGESFGGFLRGADIIFEAGRCTIINIMIIYSCTDDKAARIEKLKKFIDNVYQTSYKFSSIVQECYGFLFYIKNQVNSEEILEIVDRNEDYCMTEAMLHDYIEKHCSSISSHRTWKVVGFMQPINWSGTNDHKKHYVTLLTLRHSLGDGLSIIFTLKKALGHHFITDAHLKEVPSKRPLINLSNAYVHTNLLSLNGSYKVLKDKSNINWNLVKYIETTPKYVSIIKAIRRQLKVGFIDVIGAAIGASVKDYIVKRNKSIKSFTMASIVRVHENEVQEIISGRYTHKELCNASSGEFYTNSIGAKDDSITKKILAMHRASNSLRNSVDFLFPYLSYRYILAYLPANVTNFVLEKFLNGPTVTITNLVGFEKCSYFGCPIDDIYFCSPWFLQTGFTFLIFSYENRLSVTLNSDRGYVQNREELQTILDNTFKYLDEAEREILQSAV